MSWARLFESEQEIVSEAFKIEKEPQMVLSIKKVFSLMMVGSVLFAGGAVAQTASPSPIATPGGGLRQERYIDLIEVSRLVPDVPAAQRTQAKAAFEAWNINFESRDVELSKALSVATSQVDFDRAHSDYYQARKKEAFDKLVLFEQFGIGRYFFARGATTPKGRFDYVFNQFQTLEQQGLAPKAPTKTAQLTDGFNKFMASLQTGSGKLVDGAMSCLVEEAMAEADCDKPASSLPVPTGCKILSASFHAYNTVDGKKLIRFKHDNKYFVREEPLNPIMRGENSDLIPETHYVCTNPKNNISLSKDPMLTFVEIQDFRICENGSKIKRYNEFRSTEEYYLDNSLVDGPIPAGCVGINKLGVGTGKISRGYMQLNAAPCWEDAWECRYRSSPLTAITDVKLLTIPEELKCP